MKKKQILMYESPSNSNDVFIEVDFTRAENIRLRKLARRRHISVPELLRQDALEYAKNEKLGDELLVKVRDSTDELAKIYKAAVSNGTLLTVDLVGMAMLESVDAYEQLARWYERRK